MHYLNVACLPRVVHMVDFVRGGQMIGTEVEVHDLLVTERVVTGQLPHLFMSVSY